MRIHGGHMFMYGLFAFFLAMLLNSLLKNWLNINLSSVVGGA